MDSIPFVVSSHLKEPCKSFSVKVSQNVLFLLRLDHAVE